MQRWVWSIGAGLALWLASLLWVHHVTVTSERAAQVQKIEKVTKQHKKVREKVDGQVNALPEAPTAPVATAPDGSAASELLRDWSRPR